MSNYKSKAIITTIKFSSRASICVDKNYYTVECCEERVIPEEIGVDIQEERRALWETVNGECDRQIEDILRTFNK